MSSAVAVLTWNRLPALKACLESFKAHLPLETSLAVFEDAGERDDTRGYLTENAPPTTLYRPRDPYSLFSTTDIRAAEESYLARAYHGVRGDGNTRRAPEGYLYQACAGVLHVLGTRNLGVAGNSNRALRWMLETDADHFLLCNDDVLARGDFAAFYRQAHADLGVGLFCFCDLPGEKYVPVRARMGAYGLKLVPTLTGMVLSLTREAVETVGYFDTRVGKFGEEHCEYQNRLRAAGFLTLEGQVQHNLDVEHELLASQSVGSTMTDTAKSVYQTRASAALRRVSARYLHEGLYRPYNLFPQEYAGVSETQGIRVDCLRAGYSLV